MPCCHRGASPTSPSSNNSAVHSGAPLASHENHNGVPFATKRDHCTTFIPLGSKRSTAEGPLTILAAGSVLPFSTAATGIMLRLPRYMPLNDLHMESSKSFILQIEKHERSVVMLTLCAFVQIRGRDGLQSMFPFIAAGAGMVGTGLLLDHAASWELFTSTPETFILVPALLGLKGNLEMTLASRLSTMSNMGLMGSATEQLKVACVNLALTQAQAIVVSFIAALFTIIVSIAQNGQTDYGIASMLIASSMVTATLASFIIGLVMIIVVTISMKLSINPDNIATPIAACLGDLTTLALLILIGTLFHSMRNTPNEWILTTVYVSLLIVAPFWAYLSAKDASTLVVLKYGWWPVICAMIISRSALEIAIASLIPRALIVA
ncbi:unnamed protein product [Anisakis simplex]|uniref:MgtE domain-containing protein n=1 Tax=Anisakis simplex TaxID=6269 RepID=A0A0M3J1I6_ANISI|nr:unnamed protein product [Anisakis simplex]